MSGQDLANVRTLPPARREYTDDQLAVLLHEAVDRGINSGRKAEKQATRAAIAEIERQHEGELDRIRTALAAEMEKERLRHAGEIDRIHTHHKAVVKETKRSVRGWWLVIGMMGGATVGATAMGAAYTSGAFSQSVINRMENDNADLARQWEERNHR